MLPDLAGHPPDSFTQLFFRQQGLHGLVLVVLGSEWSVVP
jgi:hypothetical protein